MEITGKIKVIEETQTIGASNFRKRGLVVTTDEQYPQMIMIEFVQDKVDLLDKYAVGQDVKVSINLRGREWINPEGKAVYFNQIQGWRIELNANDGTPVNQPKTQGESEPDDLPF